MATTDRTRLVDTERTRLVDDLLDSLAALKRSTTPQSDLKAIAADLLDHAADLDQDERIEPWSADDFAVDEGEKKFDIARDEGRL